MWTIEERGTGVTSRTVEETNAADWPFAIYVPSPPFALGAVGALVSSHDGALSRAHLIAAAPDLLAACKAALGAFERNDCIDWNDLTRAIAKAEER